LTITSRCSSSIQCPVSSVYPLAKMNDENAKRQINAMISFIMQEAKEKADDIKKNTENEFSVDKLSRERNLNLVVREEFARKRKERLTSKKIERSRKATEVRKKCENETISLKICERRSSTS